MKFSTRLISALAGLTLAMQTVSFMPLSTVAETVDNKNYVTVLVDTSILGQGYFIQPTLVEYEDNDTVYTITERLFNDLGVEIEGSSGYLSGIKGADTGNVTFPDWLLENETFLNNHEDTNSDDVLGEFDYSNMSGWLYRVNDISASVGMDSFEIIDDESKTVDVTSGANLSDGNVVIRWVFSAYGYGADLGYDGWNTSAMVDTHDKSDLYSAMAYANYYGYSGTSYDDAYKVAIDFKSSVEDISTVTKDLNTSVEKYLNGDIKDIGYTIDFLEDGVSNYLLNNVENPTVGSVGGEWAVIQLARSGNMTETFKNKYLKNLNDNLASDDGLLSTNKATDYERVILALSALGYDASNYEGYDLVSPLADYDFTVKQGLNGAIYGLLALDTCKYEIPTCAEDKTQNSREKLLEYVLSKQLEDGGWTFGGSNYDVDMTAMTLQALAPYYSTNDKVKSAVDKAVDLLANVQCKDGGYASWGKENPCSATQVLCALSMLNIDALKDTRFITDDGDTILSYLMNFATVDNDNVSFKFQLNSNIDGMTTEQIGYSLTAYNRFLNNKKSLYDYSDVVKSTEDTTTSADVTTTTEDTTTSADITTTTEDTTTSNDVTTTTKEPSVIEVTVLGDINGDNDVKSNDLLALKKYLLGLDDLSKQALANADVTQDGEVKSNDLLLLKKYLLGLIDSFQTK
ncbi:MAG: hypothetical protein KH373_02505 [Ruminococcus sp.]|nr:hypothetical protein [Ruminococcus sp.]